jgi:formyltetrahydrofolate synthetase
MGLPDVVILKIAQQAKMSKITDLENNSLGIPEDKIEYFGKFKAKVQTIPRYDPPST